MSEEGKPPGHPKSGELISAFEFIRLYGREAYTRCFGDPPVGTEAQEAWQVIALGDPKPEEPPRRFPFISAEEHLRVNGGLLKDAAPSERRPVVITQYERSLKEISAPIQAA